MKWIKSLFFLAFTIVTFSCSKEELECSNCIDISLAKDMKVSIIGDSYSTFKGYLSPSSNPAYYPQSQTAYSGGYPFSISGDIRSVPS